MFSPVFFPKEAPLSLQDIADLAGIPLSSSHAGQIVTGTAPLETATVSDLAYMDNPKYIDALAATAAGFCLVSPRFQARVPETCIALVTPEPYRVFAQVMARLYPSAFRPGSQFSATGISPGALVHPAAKLEADVIVDPGAVIGPGAEVGSGSVIGAQTLIGPQSKIGRDCSIGPNVTIQNAFLGNHVIVHPGARIGQDGFGFAMGRQGHLKVPQTGRVIIQDDVEIGANTTIDRGANRDTVIGEGTKIDNLVQIAHNVMIGRHCIIVAQVGISGSTVLEDFVVVGGQVGIIGHIRIGMGAQIAAASNIACNVPPGERWGGTPAKPMKNWLREVATLKTLASKRISIKDDIVGPANFEI